MTDDILFMPPYQTPVKPKRDEPCNGCGWCCHMEVCYIGRKLFGEDTPAPCPGIVYKDGLVRCAVVLGEIELTAKDSTKTPFIQERLGVGQGCCSDDPLPLP